MRTQQEVHLAWEFLEFLCASMSCPVVFTKSLCTVFTSIACHTACSWNYSLFPLFSQAFSNVCNFGSSSFIGKQTTGLYWVRPLSFNLVGLGSWRDFPVEFGKHLSLSHFFKTSRWRRHKIDSISWGSSALSAKVMLLLQPTTPLLFSPTFW